MAKYNSGNTLGRDFLETAMLVREIKRLREMVHEKSKKFDSGMEKRKTLKDLESLAKDRPEDVVETFRAMYSGTFGQRALINRLSRKSPFLLDFLTQKGIFTEV